MTITAALIVRNEEVALPRCLASLGDSVDQIVVIDTGSCDTTREIARDYGAEVYEFAWRHDFAAARQFSFDRARGDWVYWLDADDELLNPHSVRGTTASASANVHGFYWKYVVGLDGHGNSTCELWRERCVRNDGRFRWHGPVHEVLAGDPACVLVRDDTVTVVHRPPPSRPYRDRRRNLDILEAEYASAPANPPPRLLLYLGNEYADHDDRERAVEFLRRYVNVSTWDDEKYLAQVRIASLLRHLSRYDDAIDAALSALKTHPHWPQACFSLAETYYFLQDWPKVVHWAESGHRLPPPDTLCVINPLAWRYDWIIHYCNALFHVGRIADALEWSRRALAIRPDDPWHRDNAAVFENLQEAV